MKQSCHWLLVGGLMMTSLGTFAETQGCLFPPSSETSSIGQVVPWSRSAHRRQSSSWLTRKLLIQLLQTSTHTHNHGSLPGCYRQRLPSHEDMWMDRIKCSSPSPPLSSHLSHAPTVLYLFQFPPIVPFTTVKRKCVDLRRCPHPARPSAFSRLNEEMNEWINLSLFTETLWVLRWCRGYTERNHSRQNISMEKNPGVLNLQEQPASGWVQEHLPASTSYRYIYELLKSVSTERGQPSSIMLHSPQSFPFCGPLLAEKAACTPAPKMPLLQVIRL